MKSTTQMEGSLKLSFSPCPNDTFMFDALINKRIYTHGLTFDTSLHDIEDLNKRASLGMADITKISFAHYPEIASEYQLLSAGAALGYNNGPLLIARESIPLNEISQRHIAIPGRKTTANLLFSIAFPEALHKTEFVFSDIEQSILDGKVDAGLLIHETRFTYQERGLVKLIDLGAYWEETTGLPIPLGAIAIRRSLPSHIKSLMNTLVSSSVQHALGCPADSVPYTRQYAQSLDPKVCEAHIQLYVNEFSVNLGIPGRQAVFHLFRKGAEAGILPQCAEEKIFTD